MIQRSLCLVAVLALSACALRPPASDTLASGVRLDHFDTHVAPGDDFYRYVNGGWLARTEIPADRSNYGSFSILHDDTERQLRAIVESLAPAVGGDGDEARIATLYADFMDQARLDALGLAPLQPLLARIDAIDSRAALTGRLAELQRLDINLPLGIAIYPDAGDASRYAVYISQGGLGLPDREYYLAATETFDALRTAYHQHIERMFELAGQADAADQADAVMALETALAQAHWTRVESRDREKTYNPVDVVDLDAAAPGLDWQAWLAALDIAEPALILRQPSAIQAATGAIDALPLAQWRAYLRFRVLSAYAPYLATPFDDEHFSFFGTRLRGIEAQRERWKRGLGVVESAVGEALGALYVERHFPPEAKARMERMVEHLLAAYGQSIARLDWMGDATRAQALDKLGKIGTKIGHPDRWQDYSTLEITAGDLIGNLMRARHFAYEDAVAKLGGPVDRDEWFMTPQTVNAYYSPATNEIVFPAAILQPPFFDVQADDAINYGAIGGVIGHEIGHAFDDQGSRYDGDGNLRNWWTDDDRARFEARTGDLIRQYDGYCPLEGHCVNGALAIGENIGDLGGLSIAYAAYRLSRGGEPDPGRIDGFDGAQRFFIGWAQIWARLFREQELLNRLKTGPHSPDEFRANGIVRNVDGWYDAFDIGPDAALYLPPEQRVRIW